ncbi:UDP-N-acetylmuramyl-(pentapeptide)--undecaprenyl-phosphate N-acetylmuramyl-(pentapeptide)-phosphotransferase [Citrifermentans bemidjiense Bem]|uniref:Phospho-N-acetylmuramoyl-pentapeptide-transferase n=1 Tax=Citrifermentans bemidjiense (strain ATCC BAA-1014 / DSM 16622 / JCM 12645 / Bem) TaxID=404380 RepID=MRAY_CITBB|nr:phospho-N-acetylmuramoyl-pentapeptide-transferase [Citrifermentans bemidjiense]B5EBP8.1 RecName: Full=Phospho-N-acetylmuramoyl-pentapeptide-transferase; AltName: Full=UDP-MurNAc-pentapeptide phosphotransferase [Citrifermentans bemidjiense Bem]ACH37517.1 UDP-N-acetylmuramyl-(pentapeptide)--undecaprenyl-phosphate N-acetylmuramyl-(pentapeptide)-phosphotransferase [Citrifermentans bemidjiense Bem]
MLYHLLYPLASDYKLFNVFKYLTFRSIYAMITALLLAFIVGPWVVRKLEALQARQVIRTDGPESHLKKQGTPTMGGVLILVCIVLPTLLWADLKNVFIWLTLLIIVGYGVLGFVDDYKKVVEKNPKGLSPRQKMFWQMLLAAGVGIFLFYLPGFSTELYLPFFKRVHPELGILFIPFVMLVIVGASNAVNLTDGLDGLAIGPVAINAATYLLFCYIAGNAKLSGYLQIPYVPGAGELAVLCGAMVGAGLGFLWYNSYPAEVFMGDVGSLSLGGALGTLAVLTKQEILLVIVGGVFVVEALSVIFQVGSYKYRGKRIFRMAPIHHHFELKGVAEPKIIVRFWIITIILALVAISTLKMR